MSNTIWQLSEAQKQYKRHPAWLTAPYEASTVMTREEILQINFANMTEYPTCKTCKHWGNSNSTDSEDGIEVRICLNPMVCAKTSYGHDKSMTSSGVLKFDEGGCTGDFTTGPDFGCIHHET